MASAGLPITIGKGEVDSSILSGGTIFFQYYNGLAGIGRDRRDGVVHSGTTAAPPEVTRIQKGRTETRPSPSPEG
jgi:hypothetical protein